MWRSEELDKIPIHFILCTERTGSSLITTMLNMNPFLIVASEEPFALYFYRKYGKINYWNEIRIKTYINEFYDLFEKNANLYFEHKDRFTQCLLAHASILNYERLIKLTYLNFYDREVKNKDSIQVILDKQMKYVFHKKEIALIFPSATFLILTRDILNNIEAKSRRGIDFFRHPYYLSNVWKLTYDEAMSFPNTQVLHFESFISNPESSLRSLNKFWGVSYNHDQLNYQAGFSLLINHRSSLLAPEYIKKISEFHRGILDKEPRVNEPRQYLTLKQKEVILKKTHKTIRLLGYSHSQISGKTNIFDELCWSFYWLLALFFRPYLWKTYRQFPIRFKRIIRQRKNQFKP